MKNNNNHLKISKPIFFKKIRLYNDLSKKERFAIAGSLNNKNNLIVKSSYLEKILEHEKNSFFSMAGGVLFFSSLEKNKRQIVFDSKIYNIHLLDEKPSASLNIYYKVCLSSVYNTMLLLKFFKNLNLLKFKCTQK